MEMVKFDGSEHITATDSGLVFNEGYTEEEHLAAGKALAKMGDGIQWAIGDWYNAIPSGQGRKDGGDTKKSTCIAAGLHYATCTRYGMVASHFTLQTRVHKVAFAQYRVVESLPEDQRTMLLERSAAEKWTTAQIIAEKKKLQQPPAIPAPQPQPEQQGDNEQQEDKEMKGKKNWQTIAVEENIATAGSGSSMHNAKQKIDGVDPTVRASGNEDAIRAVCRQIYLMEHPEDQGKAEADAEAMKADLKPTAQQKVDRAVQARLNVELARLRTQYQIELAAGIKAATAAKEAYFAEKEAEIKANLREAYEKKVQADLILEKAKEYARGVGSHLTMNEYRLIRGCLHSDRLPDDLKQRFDTAAILFQRLEKTVNVEAT